jgi:hypothetical protein
MFHVERPVIPLLRVLSNNNKFTRFRHDCHAGDEQTTIGNAGSNDGSIKGTTPKVRPAGLEPATDGLENRCSIHLSYGRRKTGLDRALD